MEVVGTVAVALHCGFFFEPSFLGIIMAFRRTWRTSWPCEQVDWFHVLRCVPRRLVELLYVFNRGFRLLKKIAFL
jgi:hypothetical protein